MTSGRLILKNSLWLIGGEVLGKFSVFLLVMLAARNLTVESFGQYNLAMSFVMIFAVINDLGLNIFLFRELARQRNDINILFSNVFMMRVLLSLIFVGVVFILSTSLGYSPKTLDAILILAGWNALTSLTYVCRTVYKSMERMHWDMAVNLIDNIVRLGIVLGLVLYGLNLSGLCWSYFFGALVTFVVSIFVYRSRFGRWTWSVDFALWGRALAEMRYLALAAILIPLFGKFDSLILAHVQGHEAVGIYGASLKLVWMLIMIPGLLVQSSFPKLSQFAFVEPDKFSALLSDLLKVVSIGTVLAALCFSALGDWIIQLVYGASYSSSTAVFRILIWCLPLYGINTLYIYALNAMNRQRTNAAFIGISIVVNVLLSLLVVQRWGLIGVALSTTGGLLLLSVMFGIYVYKNGILSVQQLRIGVDDLRKVRCLWTG